MSSREPLLEQFRLKFRTEYICLKCRAIRDDKHVVCHEVLPSGLLCGGPICPRIIRVYPSRGDYHG